MTLDCKPRHTITPRALAINKNNYVGSLERGITILNHELNRMHEGLSPNPCILENMLPDIMSKLRRYREQELIARTINWESKTDDT